MLPKSGQAQDRIRGTVDLPLSETGKTQVDELGKLIARAVPGGKVDHILHSDLIRGRQTAKAIQRHAGGELQRLDALRPWPQGKFEGAPTHAVKGVILHYATKKPDEPLPGIGPYSGENGTSFNDFKDHWLEDGLIPLLDEAEDNPSLYILAVTHSRNIKVAKGWCDKGCPDDYSIDPNALDHTNDPPGSVYHFSPKGMTLVHLGSGQSLPKGLTLVRHGVTKWNGENSESVQQLNGEGKRRYHEAG